MVSQDARPGTVTNRRYFHLYASILIRKIAVGHKKGPGEETKLAIHLATKKKVKTKTGNLQANSNENVKEFHTKE